MTTDRKSGVNTGHRDADGRFAPGNPGKPRGTRHKATLAALALLSGEAEGLTRKAVELALAGDVTALRLCIERLVPPCRKHRSAWTCRASRRERTRPVYCPSY
jgi:hypothetical protein